MKSHEKQDRAWLLATAKAVANELKHHSKGTSLRVRTPSRVAKTNTKGWSALIGTLGKGQTRLEVWFDQFSGHPKRKLYACFYSCVRPQIISIVERVSKNLWPVRVVTIKDVQGDKCISLSERLSQSEFNMPVLEKFQDGETLYGIYDPTRTSTKRVNSYFCTRAVSFFEEVARSQRNATGADEQAEVYPQIENRKRVRSHLQRERSKLLAVECKNRDGYKCQVCGLSFKDVYGKLGKGYAEAHHLMPLAKLRDDVRTQLDDLITVCANCHRMLHRMDGVQEDIRKLKGIVKRRRK